MGTNYGQPFEHDPTFNGPIHNRSCTDILFLIAFILSLGVWGFIGYYSATHGSVEKLLAPIDSNGQLCGVDEGVVEKKYLLFFDIKEFLKPGAFITGVNTKKKCVEQCPSKTVYFWAENVFSEYQSSIECTDDIIDKHSLNWNKADKYMTDGKCTRYVIQSQPVLGRCFPDAKAAKQVLENISKDNTKFDAPNEEQIRKGISSLVNFDQLASNVVNDLKSSRWVLVGGLAMVVILCYVYILLLRWVVGPIVWGSIVGLVALLSYVLYLSYVNYSYCKSHPVNVSETKGVPALTDIDGMMSYCKAMLEKSDTWLGILITVGTILMILLLIVIFLRKRLLIAIALIREGSKAIFAVKSAVFFPIFPWLLQCLVIAYGVVVLVHLMSISEKMFKVVNIANDNFCETDKCKFKENDECWPVSFAEDCHSCTKASCIFTALNNPLSVFWLHIANLLCTFWTVYFVSGAADMMLASTFATWYWTFKKKDLPFFTLTVSIYRTVRYHMGTVAFGSLIIAIIRIIRLILEYIDHKLKKYNNMIVRCVLCLCKCCFACLEKILKMINKNVYIMCAIRGKNFCSSGKSALSLIMRNILRVAVLDKVTGFIFFLSKLLISAGTGVGMYYFLEGNYLKDLEGVVNVQVEQLNYNYIPAIIIAVFAYLISSIFFNVYAMAVDTLFLCFLEDCERNDGSAEKPYFMSKNLMKILGKKNKKD